MVADGLPRAEAAPAPERAAPRRRLLPRRRVPPVDAPRLGLLLLLVVVVAAQFLFLQTEPRTFWGRVAADPSRLGARYPELRGVSGWEALLDRAGRVVPDGATVVFVAPAVDRSDAAYAYYQTAYSLFPRPVVSVRLPQAEMPSPDELLAIAAQHGAPFAVVYRFTGEALPVTVATKFGGDVFLMDARAPVAE